MSDDTPSLEQVLDGRRASLLGDFLVHLPARVDAYDKDRQCVDATPLPLVREEQEDGSVLVKQLPTVMSAPVLFPGAGPFRLTFPVQVGATVMLEFTSSNLARWLAVGGQVEATDDRRHDICSAMAYPGGHSFAGETAPSTEAPDDAMVLHAPKLRHGGPGADDPVCRLSDLQQVLDYAIAVNARVSVHTHPVATTGSASAQSGTASATGAASPSAPSPTGSAVSFTL